MDLVLKWTQTFLNIAIAVIGFFIISWMTRVENSMDNISVVVAKMQTTLAEVNMKTQSTADEVKILKEVETKLNDRIYNLSYRIMELEKDIEVLELKKKKQ